jgi:hypothetical protein
LVAVGVLVAHTALVAPAGAESDGTSEPSAPVGASITIVLDSHDPQDFAYRLTGGSEEFLLDDDNDAGLANRRTVSGLAPGAYDLTQAPVAGWRLVGLTCTSPETIDHAGRRVAVEVAWGDEVVCTFTNAPDRPLVGAIRWEAWNDGPPGRAVEYTLGPEHWHGRLPWFAEITGPGTVLTRADTQEAADAEIAFGAAFGLDYFAFNVGDENAPPGSEDEAMSRGLRLYRSSPNRDLVKYTVHIATDGLADPIRLARILEYMRDPNWVKVDGRPLIFIGMGDGLRRTVVRGFSAASVEQGTGKPYVVYIGIGSSKYQSSMGDLREHGYDAVSAYTSGGGLASDGSPYSVLAGRAHAEWDSLAAGGNAVVPTLMTGWDPRPRLERPR